MQLTLRIIDLVVAIVIPFFMVFIGRRFTARENARESQLNEIKDLQQQIFGNSEKVNSRLTDLEISTKVHDNLLQLIVNSLHMVIGKEPNNGK
jgi:uncharacterized membrane protein